MSRPHVVIVLPAYQAQGTLAATVGEIPAEPAHTLLLVDDGSTDRTVEVARSLGIHTLVHAANRGYGANQKTCYREALALGADVVVMIHPDHQYDARALPELVAPLAAGTADVVLGSRFLGPPDDRGGMPPWRVWGNRALTSLQNHLLHLNLSEYHTGLRAFRRDVLATLDLETLSDDFLFDQQILVEALRHGFRITEVRARARYFRGASSISPRRSLLYGVQTLRVTWRGRAR